LPIRPRMIFVMSSIIEELVGTQSFEETDKMSYTHERIDFPDPAIKQVPQFGKRRPNANSVLFRERLGGIRPHFHRWEIVSMV